MNERIQELAVQSGLEELTNPYQALEKFAELIVRECMDNLAWHGHDEAVSQLDWFLHHKIRGEK